MTVRTLSPMTTRALLCLAMGALAGPASGHTIGLTFLALTGTAADTLPDLEVRVRAPRTLAPGEALGSTALVRVRNGGTVPAPRTYMIDLVLGSDRTAPAGFAGFSPTYREDVLLRGGRLSGTRDLAPGAVDEHRPADASIPEDTPPGSYVLCARVDPGGAVAESDEANNVDCAPLQVEAAGARPLEGAIAPRANPPKPAAPPIARDVIRPRLPVPLPAPTTGCPDPAVVELSARLVSRSRTAPRTQGTVEIVGIVENVGRFAYESGPGQQALRLYELAFEFLAGDDLVPRTGISGRPVASADFPSLRPGGRVVAYHTVYIDLDVIRPGFRAAIEYDLDIRNDGNPQNDDCDTGNNQREINAEIQRLFGEE